MPLMNLMGSWDQPEPDEAKVVEALMELGFYDIEVDMDSDDNPHGWGR